VPICKEKYVNGILVSRLCIQGDLFFLKNEFPKPNYELSAVDSCDQCPAFPTPSLETNSRDEIQKAVKYVFQDKEFLKSLKEALS
jgi:hypothetical protein